MTQQPRIGSWRWLAIALVVACLAPRAMAQTSAPAASQPAIVDDDVLRVLAAEVRILQLAACAEDAGVQLPRDRMLELTRSHPLYDQYMQVRRGTITRDQFLQGAPIILKARNDQVQTTLGNALPTAAAMLRAPYRQAVMFDFLLLTAIGQMHLPAQHDAGRRFMNQVLQNLLEEDSSRKLALHSGRPAPPEHDEDWLRQYRAGVSSQLMGNLPPAQQRELVRVWPILFGQQGAPRPPAVTGAYIPGTNDAEIPPPASVQLPPPLPTRPRDLSALRGMPYNPGLHLDPPTSRPSHRPGDVTPPMTQQPLNRGVTPAPVTADPVTPGPIGPTPPGAGYNRVAPPPASRPAGDGQ